METVTDFIFLGSKITADGDCSHETKDTCSLEEKLWPTSVQFNSLSHVWLFGNPWAAACLAALSNTTSRAYSNSCPSSQWYCPSISWSVVPFSSWLQSFPASGSFLMSWLLTSGGRNWSFSFSISPSNKYSELISFRMDWFDLLALQGTLKNLLQHHSSKASILLCSAFFIVQISHPYNHWKNHSLD